jgi:hypothetical protein
MEPARYTLDSLPSDEIAAYETQGRLRRATKIEMVLRLYGAFGLIISAGASGYLAVSLVRIDLSSSQQLALIIAGTSLGIAVLSYLLLIFRKQQRLLTSEFMAQRDFISTLVRQWGAFEMLGRELLTARGEAFNPHSPRAILSALVQDDLISRSDLDRLYAALDVRNQAVHGVEAIPAGTLYAAGEILSHVNELLQREIQAAASSKSKKQA